MLVVLLAGLAIAALLALVSPLLRAARSAPERGQFDKAVYRDQLQELERDIARGLVSAEDSVAARLEIQRRLLAVDVAPQVAAGRTRGRSPVLAVLIVVFAVCGAGAVYLRLGTPAEPNIVFPSRTATAGMSPAEAVPAHSDMADAAESLAQKLAANPNDAEAWELLARTSGSLRRWDVAADAYRHAIALGRTGAEVQSGLGEMLIMQTEGIITPAAHDAFATALQADPKNDVARYYMAMAAGQAGQPGEAIQRLQGLLADIPEDSPMREEVGKRINEAARAAGLPMPELAKGTPAATPEPDADDLDAEAAMPEGDQKVMVESMIAKLAAKLDQEPNDADGWMRLGRAYAVMRQSDKAADAYTKATALKPGDVVVRLEAVDGLLAGLKPNDVLPDAALALLKQVEAITPDEPEVLWYLGVAAARDAHADEAKRYWNRLLAKLPPEGDNTRMVKSALDQLKGG